MSDKSNSEKMARQRLLKANNVQRRRFEKMAETAVNTCSRHQHNVLRDKREAVYKQVVEETMGHDLKVLLGMRDTVQSLKQQIDKVKEGAEKVRQRLVKRGISASSSSYRHPLNYYIDPPAVDEKSEDVCVRTIGNPHVQLRLMECSNNEPYRDYKERIASFDHEEEAFNAAADALMADIWALTTTEEIVEAINKFREEWNG
jgi:hypothetical protein